MPYAVRKAKLQDFAMVKPPQCAPLPNEETLIEEVISQDATEKWLDTLNDTNKTIQFTNITNSSAINFKNYQISPQFEKTKPGAKKTDNLPHYHVIIEDEDQNETDLDKSINKNSCKICSKTFFTPNTLNWHMRLHDTNRKRFICPIQQCGRIYASKYSCDLHYKQAHLDEGFLCHICQRIFTAKQSLDIHMRYHTKEFPYQCNICQRKFSQKGHLTHHVEVKHHNLRYICTEPGCGKVFQNSVSLRNHHYTHSSMPFKCNRCDKQYPQKNKLRVHLLNKHNITYSLDGLEEMRQFNIIRTRHAFTKVQTARIEESVIGFEEHRADDNSSSKTVPSDK